MAGYSSTPLVKKLGIKPDSKVLFINEPANFYEALGELPENIRNQNKLNDKYDYVHYFAYSKIELESLFGEIEKFLKKDGMVWISWPKKASGVKVDLDENVIREVGLTYGLVDVKVAAIDNVWSGLKFVYRLKDR